jgi:hypothetical protein
MSAMASRLQRTRRPGSATPRAAAFVADRDRYVTNTGDVPAFVVVTSPEFTTRTLTLAPGETQILRGPAEGRAKIVTLRVVGHGSVRVGIDSAR